MAGLLYKELIINKKNIIDISAGILLSSIFAFIPVHIEDGNIFRSLYTLGMMALCIFWFMLAGGIQQGIFSPDEQKKWSNYIASIPVSVKGQVLSKYYFSLLISIAILFYCTLIYGINAVIQGMDSGAMKIAIIIFTLQTFIHAVEFPFLIRFGSKNGNKYRMVIFWGACLIFFIYVLFGDLSIFGTFDGFMNWLIKMVSGQMLSDGWLLLLAISPFVTGALYYFSYRISCRLYLKGAENYDK